MLPASSDDLLEQYKSSSAKPKFKQILTLGPRRIREVPPVFVIPGLYNAKTIHESFFSVLHPTFVAELPNTTAPLDVIAKDLADVCINFIKFNFLFNLIFLYLQEIMTIFPKGPYNVVGISWGGALLIEIGKILQQRASTQLTFIDSAPYTISTTISHLGESVSVEVNVLLNLLNITSAEVSI